MRKLYTCLFYGLCVFTIAFSLFWMALPRLTLPSPAGSETPPSSAEESLAAQALPELSAQGYLLQDKGGRVAVYRCDADGTAGALLTVTGIYTNLLPETTRCASSRASGCTASWSWTSCWKTWGSKPRLNFICQICHFLLTS